MRHDRVAKAGLFEYKEQLEFSRQGKNLLDEKREVLMMRLRGTLKNYQQKREEMEEKWGEFYKKFLFLKTVAGEESISEIASVDATRPHSMVEIREISVMGLVLPEIVSGEKNAIAVRNFLGTNVFYDECYVLFQEIFGLVVEVAQMEAWIWRLAGEIQKTQRKANVLETVFIPELSEMVKLITDASEEREREMLFQMKKVKKSYGNEI